MLSMDMKYLEIDAIKYLWDSNLQNIADRNCGRAK